MHAVFLFDIIFESEAARNLAEATASNFSIQVNPAWFSCRLLKKVNLRRFKWFVSGSLVFFVFHTRHFCDLISFDNLITHSTRLKHSDHVLPNSWSCSAGLQIGMWKLEFLREKSAPLGGFGFWDHLFGVCRNASTEKHFVEPLILFCFFLKCILWIIYCCEN